MDAMNQIPVLPPTPPSMPSSPQECLMQTESTTVLPCSFGLEVLAAERDGLVNLHKVYSNSAIAQKGFASAVDLLVTTTQQHGRVVVSGVGKSGLIGQKMIATLNSLGIRAGWMHPTEALHGDLGMIGPHDALILITFSGNTAELLSLMDHLPASSPVILMTSALPNDGGAVSDLPLFAARIDAVHENNILLPTPVPVAEKSLFGVSAPTVSTTVTLALGDALAMAAARKLHEHQDGVKDVFKKYHPGGAIGKANAMGEQPVMIQQDLSDGPPSSASSVSLGGSTVGDVSDTEIDESIVSTSTTAPDAIVASQNGIDGAAKLGDFEVSKIEQQIAT